MYSYLAYNLGIYSNRPLPELIPAPCDCEVTIEIKDARVPSKPPITAYNQLDLNHKCVELIIDQAGRFLIQNGNSITIEPYPDVSNGFIRQYILGISMAILLYQRGRLVLHASAVEINGGGYAFMGISGSGKSSIAIAFIAKGYRLISDDVTAVEISEHNFWIAPGYPQVKISREVAAAVGLDADSLFELQPLEEKHGYRPKDRFAGKQKSLRAIFVLKNGEPTTGRKLSSQQAMLEVIRHSLPTRLRQSSNQNHFESCAQLVRNVPFYWLQQTKNLVNLPHTVRTISDLRIG